MSIPPGAPDSSSLVRTRRAVPPPKSTVKASVEGHRHLRERFLEAGLHRLLRSASNCRIESAACITSCKLGLEMGEVGRFALELLHHVVAHVADPPEPIAEPADFLLDRLVIVAEHPVGRSLARRALPVGEVEQFVRILQPRSSPIRWWMVASSERARSTARLPWFMPRSRSTSSCRACSIRSSRSATACSAAASVRCQRNALLGGRASGGGEAARLPAPGARAVRRGRCARHRALAGALCAQGHFLGQAERCAVERRDPALLGRGGALPGRPAAAAPRSAPHRLRWSFRGSCAIAASFARAASRRSSSAAASPRAGPRPPAVRGPALAVLGGGGSAAVGPPPAGYGGRAASVARRSRWPARSRRWAMSPARSASTRPRSSARSPGPRRRRLPGPSGPRRGGCRAGGSPPAAREHRARGRARRFRAPPRRR